MAVTKLDVFESLAPEPLTAEEPRQIAGAAAVQVTCRTLPARSASVVSRSCRAGQGLGPVFGLQVDLHPLLPPAPTPAPLSPSPADSSARPRWVYSLPSSGRPFESPRS